MDRLEKQRQDEVELPPNGTSLDLLQAVYRNNDLPLPVRMRAALGAVAFEHPKLIATAVVNEGSFAELLERRLQHFERMKLIEAQPTNELEIIEQPTNGNGSELTDVKPIEPAPLTRIYSNRFRRRL